MQSHTVQASPHYSTTRRHSLYGTEDRIVIDPGSLIWKIGFSGEGKPRAVFYASEEQGRPLWCLNRETEATKRAEEDRQLNYAIERCLRTVFHSHLLVDPKARKVIIIEHPLLPLHVKDVIARVLFENLQVPSISFASSHLLSLFSSGRITGMVLDCGHLESVVLPIFAARPLFPLLKTTPLAGSRLRFHLRALLLMFGTYLPPPTTLGGVANIPLSSRSTRVPEAALTETVLEEIITRCCFVSEPLAVDEDDEGSRPPSPSDNMGTPPPTSDPAESESEFSHIGGGSRAPSTSLPESSSEFSIVSSSQVPSRVPERADNHLQAMATMYTRHSTATELHFQIQPPMSQQNGTGLGVLIVPGWVRERAAEVLFEGGDVDESSIAEVILDCLLKVPVDLRKTLASSLLITGGTPMLPGFIQRLHSELLRAVNPLVNAPPPRQPTRPDRPPPPRYDKYASLRPLIPYFAILNNPAPGVASSERAAANAGKAPAFAPSLMAWVGGSLAGSLKTGGAEVSREKWDEQEHGVAQGMDEDEEDADLRGIIDSSGHGAGGNRVLPDWTRTPVAIGAR